MAGLIVFDAGVIIAALTSSDRHHRGSVGLMEELEELDFAMSGVTFAEALIRPMRERRAEELVTKLDQLLVLRLGLDGSDALGLAEVREASGLKMPDAIVLYTAQREESALATTDVALARAAEDRGVTAHLVADDAG